LTRVILQPAGDPHARKHYADTIASPVPQDRLERLLDPQDLSVIKGLYGSEPVPTWGVTPGGREVNRKKWDQVTPGDMVLMARDGEIFVSARVTHKAHNEQLAEDLWGRNEAGSTWEYLYFLDDVASESFATSQINHIVGYRPGARVQGFNVLDEEKSQLLLEALGLDSSQPTMDAHKHLRGLVGATIPTLTGRANRIIEVRGEDVLVGTERSPEGQPVPIEWIQDAMDRLVRDRVVEISVESVGHRSAFVGAVLNSLRGTRSETNPRRVFLDGAEGPVTAGSWREPPEILDAMDAINELAGRPPVRRPGGRRQSAPGRKAIELRAVAMAISYFEERGWDVEDVGSSASYDLRCKKGRRLLHVEVKGTTSRGKKVLMTRNEVHHAQGTDAELALYVLSGVAVDDESEPPVASGGTERVLDPWQIEDSALDPVGYEYTLPLEP
jgi:hypothetical protein